MAYCPKHVCLSDRHFETGFGDLLVEAVQEQGLQPLQLLGAGELAADGAAVRVRGAGGRFGGTQRWLRNAFESGERRSWDVSIVRPSCVIGGS